jgi:hypothetical protein
MMGGTFLAGTWLSMFGQSEKQYFWRNQRGQYLHFLVQCGRWSSYLPAKFPAHVSSASMQISLWGKGFFTSVCFSPFPLPFFLLRLLSSSSSRLPPPSCTRGQCIFWSLHWESCGEVHVERAEDDLVDERPEIDNRVISFVAKLCWFAIV